MIVYYVVFLVQISSYVVQRVPAQDKQVKVGIASRKTGRCVSSAFFPVVRLLAIVAMEISLGDARFMCSKCIGPHMPNDKTPL